MIELIVNGNPYTDFTTASVTLSLEAMANDFTFTASAVNDFPPLKQGDKVEVIVDELTVLTGYIDEVTGQDSEGNHLVTYTGRDKTGDFIDSSINIIDDLRANETLTLKSLIESVISHLGQDLEVIDTLNPEPFNKAEDFVSPKVGQNAFEFVIKYAKKRQALLSSDGNGNILITQSIPVDSGATVQSLRGSDSNNILVQNWKIDASKTFNKYIHRGQLDPRALNFAGESSVEGVENQGGESVNANVRPGRQNVQVETESYSSEQLVNRAKWANQLASAKATRFTCAVRNHQKPEGGLWDVNTLVQVNSDVANISRKMLINTVTFQQGEGQPTITTLELVEKNVYTIDEKLAAQRPVGDFADAFSSLG